ncbi:MAG: family 10 glycosylhydrolase [Verrucomicrobiota bacterium]
MMRSIVLGCFSNLLLLGAVGARQTTLIDDFQTAGFWSATSPAPKPSQGSLGLIFDCPMSRSGDRLHWDRKGRFDFSKLSSFSLSFTCPDPTAIRLVALYCKSGDGWYVMNAPIQRAGMNTLLFTKGRASREGKPAGWNQVSQIRLALWKGASRDTRFTAKTFKGYTDRVYLVHATSSTRNAADRSTARQASERVDYWLNDAGITHAWISDDEVVAGLLQAPGTAILPFNPRPETGERRALGTFVKRGGQLIVCYGDDAGLAQLMQVRIGRYQSSKEFGRWNQQVFSADGFPSVVYDHAWHIIPVTPANSEGRVIAEWQHANGRHHGIPACVETPAGYWFSNILRAGDKSGKVHMLTTMIARKNPDVPGIHAAWIQNRAAARIIHPGRATNPNAVTSLLKHCSALNDQGIKQLQGGESIEALKTFRILERRQINALALAQEPAQAEWRAVWDHNGTGLYAGGWEETCRELKAHGITAVLANMMWSSKAHYPSKWLPASQTLEKFGDQVAQCTEAARRHGLEVHVWKVCWQIRPDSAFYKRCLKAGRLQTRADGRPLPWLSPSHPENIRFEINALKEVANTYDIDGIHLDYIRYKDRDGDYSSAARKAFERYLGIKVANWPADACPGGKRAGQFEQFRAREISRFVSQVHREIKAIKPQLKISAAVFGSYPDCISSRGQDWAAWLREGTVDFVTPMNYTVNPYQFEGWVRNQLQLPQARGRIFPGIGLVANESELGPDQLFEQIEVTRRLGAPGYALFKLDTPFVKRILPLMRVGMNRQ